MFRNKTLLGFLLCILLHFFSARSRSPYARYLPGNVRIRQSDRLVARFDNRLSRRMKSVGSYRRLDEHNPSNSPGSPRIATVHTENPPSTVLEAGPPRLSRQRVEAAASLHTEIELGSLPGQPAAVAHAAESHQSGANPLAAPTPQQIAQAHNICEMHGTSGAKFNFTRQQKFLIVDCCCAAGLVEGVTGAGLGIFAGAQCPMYAAAATLSGVGLATCLASVGAYIALILGGRSSST
jgi:hypothetical protein